MCIIIYAMTDGEGYMTLLIHVLDDVTYCAQGSTINDIRGNITRTKLQLELYFLDSLSTRPSLQSVMNGIIVAH